MGGDQCSNRVLVPLRSFALYFLSGSEKELSSPGSPELYDLLESSSDSHAVLILSSICFERLRSLVRKAFFFLFILLISAEVGLNSFLTCSVL